MTCLLLRGTEGPTSIRHMTRIQNQAAGFRERRIESRYRAFDVGVIKSPMTGIAVSQLLDSSRSGIRVSAPYPLPVEAPVEFLFDNRTISGSVRNCVRARAGQFHVGIGGVTAQGMEVPDAVYAALDRLTSVLR